MADKTISLTYPQFRANMPTRKEAVGLDRELAQAEIRYRVCKTAIDFCLQEEMIDRRRANTLVRELLKKYDPPISSLEVKLTANISRDVIESGSVVPNE